MSGLHSALTRDPGVSKLYSRPSDKPTPIRDSNLNKPLPPRIRSKKDELEFLEVFPGTDPVVDIIAIHGLDGHRENTWTAQNGVLWLRDLLSADIPNARILVYGYDADTRSRECVSTQTIYQHADKFIKSLSRQRTDSPRRPIIFVAHSLGGIVLKQALILCHVQTLGSINHLRDILVSTHAILFFGTPHSGVKGVELLKTMNRLLSVYLNTTEAILRNLTENSPELENIQNLFSSASEEIEIALFYEVYPTPLVGGTKQLIVPYRSAVGARDRRASEEALNADHCEMVKFQDKKSPNYVTVLSCLRRHIEGAMTAVTRKWSAEDAHRALARKRYLPPHDVLRPTPRLEVSRIYVDRPALHSLITHHLRPTRRVRHQPRCILYGIGGSGKTQLATNWIRDHESSFTRVIFVDASSQTQLEKDLELSIRSIGPEYREMTWKDAVAYLDGKDRGWLLFFDNADSPSLDLRPYLPASIHGAVLITTRNRMCTDYAPDSAVSVGNMEESEAVELLHRIANITPTSDTESCAIVRELGVLPLAIAQAGVYIRRTRRLDTYLDTFRKHRGQILRQRSDIGTEYTSSTYAAFDLSFDHLPAKTQEFLKLCAFLHHSLIPIALFEHSTSSGFTTYTVLKSCLPPEGDKALVFHLQSMFGSTWDIDSFQKVIESASSTSLIEVSSDGLFYTVHPLLQVYIKGRLNEEDNQHYMKMARQLLLGAIRPVEGSNAQLRQLLPHAHNIPRSVQSEHVAHALAFRELYESLGDPKSCRELLESALHQVRQLKGEEHEDSIWVMGKLALDLLRCHRLQEAEEMHREVLRLRLKIFGGRHLDTIKAMNGLSISLNSRGQLEEAEKLQKEALALQLELLGGRHLDTISTMHSLASTLRDRGQLEEAEKLKQEVLALRLEILGRRHLDTILAMTSLAGTLGLRGRLDEAERMEREALDLQIEIYGERHPRTISLISNLACTLFGLGRLDEAEKMEREVIIAEIEILGQRHPDTISAMHNLGATLYKRGRLDEAETIQREALTLQLELFGRRHLDTISAMAALAYTLCDRGQLDEADRLRQEVLALRLEILGESHLDTISAMKNLADILIRRGQLDEAEKVERRLLALQLEILGRQHSDTISTMGNLGVTLRDRGQFHEAERLQQQVLALLLEKHGELHPKTVPTMENLAIIFRDLDELEDAEDMDRKVLAVQLKVLGVEHLDTISAKDNLAETLRDRGKFEEAEKLKREVLALRLEILGGEHLDTISTMHRLAATLKDSGKLGEAEKIEREVLSLRLKIQGMRHPDTLNASLYLSHILHETGQLAEAAIRLQETMELRVAVFGEDDPLTMAAKELLALVISQKSHSTRPRFRSRFLSRLFS
ncbi:SubName: Full=Uncharacterized protein {ECO:0000313/EMBL:CCA68224.1} [Serendipita indica DSM 11827]|nr:SubName: Full=Uncharacterized protein {ECO:0000313/EMBL:CCA68224.1} [Serendipita indica DSM 11827]